ncbi:hypothetical protein ACOQFO_05180 [Ureibacillus sp. MALMAid1270]|uniref:hypothetical protein n=1 Tax=Ureibacillus sp. MALMAid1270 TaxID=3411629 RepID=UPI003BA413F3
MWENIMINDAFNQTVEQLFQDARIYDMSHMAHYIYFCLIKGKVMKPDLAKKIYEVELTDQEVHEFEEMNKKNLLKITPIKLFAIKHGNENYAFYFGATAEEVIALHEKRTRVKVNKITNCHNQMIDKSIYCPETKTTKTFRQMMKYQFEFPCYVCEMEAMRSTK